MPGMVTGLESHLARELKGLDGPAQRTLAASHLKELGDRFSPDAVQILRAALGRVRTADETRALAAWIHDLPINSNALRLRALIATDLSLPPAASYWRAWLNHRPGHDPADLLLYARVLSDAGSTDEAAHALRRALTHPLSYATFARSENLVSRIAAARSASPLRRCRIALLGNSTTGLMLPILKALCFRDRIEAEFYEGLYGSERQEILDAESGLARFQPEIVILPLSWRDLRSPALAVDETEAAHFVEERRMLWTRLAERFRCHVIQHASDYPAHEASGGLSMKMRGGRARVIEHMNRALWDAAPSHVSLIDTPDLQRASGEPWEDARQWFTFQQHPASAVLPAVAEAQMAHVRAVLGLTRKVLVTDLDNTLWKGVIGEDGVEGIEVGPGSPAGEAHHDLQLYLRDLKERGILLAVCSKNNPEDARLPFEKHSGMALTLEDFAAFRANWDDKAQNIRQVAADLSLGLDSFVFLDDNPLEREWVRSQIPDVIVPELGPDVFHYVRDLHRGRHFETLTLSAEDRARAVSYRVEAARDGLRSAYESMDEFLQHLQLEASVEPITSANLGRVTQLVNKTNQFNVTTRRYQEAELARWIDDSSSWAGAFSLQDRFGSYGLIGVLLCRDREEHVNEWEIETWLMSCRTLGRQMEKFMFDRLVENAVAREIRTIIGVYRPTAKNKLVSGLFEQLGFVKITESPDETRYALVVAGAPIETATHVRNASVIERNLVLR